MHVKFLVVFLFIPIASFSQSRKMVLHIDTLITNGHGFGFCVTNEGSSAMWFPSDFAKFKTDSLLTNQNYSFKISESFSLFLILDDKHGFLAIKNVYQLNSDTVRISRHVILKNCIADTLKTRIEWEDDNVPESIRKKTRTPNEIVSIGCEILPPERINYIINGRELETNPELISEATLLTRSVIKETKPKRLSFSKEKRKSYNYKFSKVTYYSILTGEINL